MKNTRTLILAIGLIFIFGMPVSQARAVSENEIIFDDKQAVSSKDSAKDQQKTDIGNNTDDFSIYLDKETIAKGYTVAPFDGDLKLSLVPGILSDDTRVDCEEISHKMPMPWSLERISPVYQFEFNNKAAYDDHKPFYIQFSYDKDTNDHKRVFFFDNNYGSWRPLPTRDYPKEDFVRSLIHLPYARIAVFTDESRMSSGKASWYAYKGGDYAASPDFPKGSRLRVYNINNNEFVDVVVNDYGPDRSIYPDRAIDLDKQAFSKIASLGEGIIDVSIKPLYVKADDRGRVLGIPPEGIGNKPRISASSAIVMSEASEDVIFEKGADDIRPLASLTKLVAVKVFLETGVDLAEKVSYKEQDEIYNHEHCKPWESAKIRLEEGEALTAKDLIYVSLVGSANNAVESLVRASGLERDIFIDRMNELVYQWGAKKTIFTEPTGLSPDNVTTARDYAIIAKEVLSDPIIKKASVASEYKFSTIGGRDIKVNNTNDLVRNNLFSRSNHLKIVGSKTGYLHEAMHCLMVRAVGPQGNKFVVVVLGAPSKYESLEEIKDLIRYGVKKENS